MGLRPTKAKEDQITGRLRSRLGKRALPSRDREGVGAVVFNGVTMGLLAQQK